MTGRNRFKNRVNMNSGTRVNMNSGTRISILADFRTNLESHELFVPSNTADDSKGANKMSSTKKVASLKKKNLPNLESHELFTSTRTALDDSSESEVPVFDKISEVDSGELEDPVFDKTSEAGSGELELPVFDKTRGPNQMLMNKMSSLKKLSSFKNMNPLKKMNSSKVVWDDSASIASCSVRSITSKSTRNESMKDPRKAFYTNFSDVGTSEVVNSLKKYDEDLGNILINQSHDAADPIVAVNRSDIQKIKLLGKGQFCNVHSVAGYYTGFVPLPELGEGEQVKEESVEASKRSVFALKAINPKRVRGDDELIVAASDLACEAKILSELDHKNIIKLRGLCCETFSRSFIHGVGQVDKSVSANRNSSQKSISRSLKRLGSFKDGAINRSLKRFSSFKIAKTPNEIEGYFLLLDVLTQVLSDRLIRQRKDLERGNVKIPKKQSQKISAMYDRTQHVVRGIVAGMQYLHSRDIVLRDLKPGNVGFDEAGEVRLFDFGMARRVSECPADEVCGSPRYMAPEVMQGGGYTLKVDVYSFGILLYELCSLEVPFANSCVLMKLKDGKKKKSNIIYTFRSIFKKKFRSSKKATEMNDDNNFSTNSESNVGDNSPIAIKILDFYRRVSCDGLRPSKNNLNAVIPCPKMRTLIKECWSADPNERPTFDEIATRLNTIFNSQ